VPLHRVPTVSAQVGRSRLQVASKVHAYMPSHCCAHVRRDTPSRVPTGSRHFRAPGAAELRRCYRWTRMCLRTAEVGPREGKSQPLSTEDTPRHLAAAASLQGYDSAMLGVYDHHGPPARGSSTTASRRGDDRNQHEGQRETPSIARWPLDQDVFLPQTCWWWKLPGWSSWRSPCRRCFDDAVTGTHAWHASKLSTAAGR
jgi:hypothetical protein